MRARTVRITARLLIALFSALTVFAPLSGAHALNSAFAAATATSPDSSPRHERASCCGGACSCGETCPCSVSNDETPSPGAPEAPSDTTRTIRLTWSALPTREPALIAKIRTSECATANVRQIGGMQPSGRSLLERLSRWTT